MREGRKERERGGVGRGDGGIEGRREGCSVEKTSKEGAKVDRRVGV